MSLLSTASLFRGVSLISTLGLLACGADAITEPRSTSSLAVGAVASSTRGAVPGIAEPFRGTVRASETDDVVPETNSAAVHIVGSGTATHLGRYRLMSELTLNLETLTGPEIVTLTAANGDVLRATANAQGIPQEDGFTINTVEFATIVGGTGRFAHATGSFTLQRVLNAATGTSTGSFAGSLSLAP